MSPVAFFRIVTLVLLTLAAVLVHHGYLALVGPLLSGTNVWWTGMIGPFVVAAITLIIVSILSPQNSGIVIAVNAYAMTLSILGLMIAGILFRGSGDQSQNHSEYAVLFLILWGVAAPFSPIFVGVALWKKIRKWKAI